MASDEVDKFLAEFEDPAGDAELPGLAEAIAEEGVEVRREDDPTGRSLAEAMEVASDVLLRVVAGPEAGEDRGEAFYTLMVEGVGLAVRQDGMRAYVTDVLEELDPVSSVSAALAIVNLSAPSSLEGRAEALKSAAEQWVCIGRGAPPKPGTPQTIQYVNPQDPREPLPPDTLSLLSMELYEVLLGERISKAELRKLSAVAVVHGDLLARGIPEVKGRPGVDVFGRTVPPGLETEQSKMEVGVNVSLDAEGHYRAERFGYLCLLDGRLSVMSPLWVSPDHMRASLLLLEQAPHPVTPEMIRDCLGDAGIVHGIREERIAELAARIQNGSHEIGLFVIAEGQPPADGTDGGVELQVDVERKAGKVLDDGSIDYRDVNFTPSVRANQLVAKRKPPRKGTPGKDVRGVALEAADGDDAPLKAGDHIRVEQKGGTELFFATIDGAVRYERGEISAVELLVVKGDVSFDTGNLSFGGEVVVDGSITQGFSVKAGGPVTITGTVEAGASVAARGIVTVGKGIVGRKTKVVSQSSVQAQFVQEATVMAGADIRLGNYAYHAQLHCGGKLAVKAGSGTNGGSVMGGQTWAIGGIEAHRIGTKAGSETLVVCGVNQEQVRKLDKVNTGLEACGDHIAHILGRFGLTQIDMTQIKNMLTASTGPRRKILAHHAHQLGKLAQVYQQLLGQKKLLEEELDEGKQAQIKVAGTVYPGTTVRIGDRRRKIVEELRGARFHVSDDKLLAA